MEAVGGDMPVYQAPPDYNPGYPIATLAGTAPPTVCGPSFDHAQQRLAQVQRVRFKQGRALMEGLTGGAMPNLFLVGDLDNMYQPMRENAPFGDPEGWPMFMIEEQSGACCERDCWCRMCCTPGHPSISYLHATSGPMMAEPCECCGQFCWHNDDVVDPVGPVIMTYERLGCCQRFSNCFVCCEMCQDELRFHVGGGDFDPNQAGDLDPAAVTAVGKVPIGGGGCTPTVEIFQTAPGQVQVEGLTPAAYVEGPTCFGGLYDWCCDTTFFVSTQPGKSGDLATIVKKKPHDFNSFCRACCTSADVYDLHMAEGAVVNPMQKALILGEMVHLDFMFFESDRFPITCERSGDTTYITCLLCLCYCYGCLLPIKCCIACSEKQNGGE